MYLYDELYHVLVSNIFFILIKFWKKSWQVSLVSFHIPPLKTILFESIILYCKFYELISIWWRYHRLWINPNDACFCHSYTDRESFIHCSIYSAHHLSSHRELFILDLWIKEKKTLIKIRPFMYMKLWIIILILCWLK